MITAELLERYDVIIRYFGVVKGENRWEVLNINGIVGEFDSIAKAIDFCKENNLSWVED